MWQRGAWLASSANNVNLVVKLQEWHTDAVQPGVPLGVVAVLLLEPTQHCYSWTCGELLQAGIAVVCGSTAAHTFLRMAHFHAPSLLPGADASAADSTAALLIIASRAWKTQFSGLKRFIQHIHRSWQRVVVLNRSTGCPQVQFYHVIYLLCCKVHVTQCAFGWFTCASNLSLLAS
jgi:hypothetical protein